MKTRQLCNECGRYSQDKGELKCCWCGSNDIGLEEIPELTEDEQKQMHEYNSR